MNPVKLLRETDQACVALACGGCGHVLPLSLPGAESYTEECCDPVLRTARIEERSAAWRLAQAEREKESAAKASRIAEADYSGWVYSDEVSGYNDGYFENPDELRDHCDAHDRPVPAEVWATTQRTFSVPDAESLCGDSCEDHHESVLDQIEDFDGLATFLTDWNAKQTAFSVDVDHKLRVVLEASRPSPEPR